jgi:hypothetical protein
VNDEWRVHFESERTCYTDGARFFLASRGADASKDLDKALANPRFPWLLSEPTWARAQVADEGDRPAVKSPTCFICGRLRGVETDAEHF